MGYIEDMRNLVGNHPLILIGSHAIILNEKNEILLQLRTYSGRDFFQIYPNGNQVHGVLVVYICREFQGELVCDHTESKELRFFPLDELPSNLPPVIERIINEFQHSNLYVK